MNYTLHQGDNIITLKTLADNSIDSIVTDPPYGIKFLGKDWDSKKASETTSKLAALSNLPSGMAHTSLADDMEFQYWLRDIWIECLRVLKPGGHVLAFSAARTYHHMAMSLQTAGFEIRDQIMWIYSSGFPKSQDVGRSIQRSQGVEENEKVKDNGRARMANKLAKTNNTSDPGFSGETTVCTSPESKQWAGWGTALKPAHEPICLARKPLGKGNSIAKNCMQYGTGALNIDATRIAFSDDDDPHATFQGGTEWTRAIGQGDAKRGGRKDKPAFSHPEQGRFPSNVIGEIAEYQKYFYCPKVGRKERHLGHEMPPPMFGDMKGCYDENGERYAVGLDARTGLVGNNHPTVKPIALMEYLIKLITPPGGTVLDPFNGSGSTGCAAVGLGFGYIGLELDPAYIEISKKRIDAWTANDRLVGEVFE